MKDEEEGEIYVKCTPDHHPAPLPLPHYHITHLAVSVMFSTRFERSSIFCWPYWASNKYLVGPIGPANDPLHAIGSGQLKIVNLLLALSGQQ